MITLTPVPDIPMIRPGDDLAALLGDAIEAARVGVKAGDVVAVCQKVVSKAEGAIVRLDDVVASPFAEHLAAATEGGKDARAVEVVLRRLAEAERFAPQEDTLTVRAGMLGAYPNMFFVVPEGNVDAFASAEAAIAPIYSIADIVD